MGDPKWILTAQAVTTQALYIPLDNTLDASIVCWIIENVDALFPTLDNALDARGEAVGDRMNTAKIFVFVSIVTQC